MDHESFNKVNLETKAHFVFNYGEYISSIEYYGRKVDLYVVGAFYVEAFYNAETQDLEQIEILDSEERRLQLYSVGVDIKSLFE
jgi:hypothetical protein